MERAWCWISHRNDAHIQGVSSMVSARTKYNKWNLVFRFSPFPFGIVSPQASLAGSSHTVPTHQVYPLTMPKTQKTTSSAPSILSFSQSVQGIAGWMLSNTFFLYILVDSFNNCVIYWYHTKQYFLYWELLALWHIWENLFSHGSGGQKSEIGLMDYIQCRKGWYFMRALRGKSIYLTWSASSSCLYSLAFGPFFSLQIASFQSLLLSLFTLPQGTFQIVPWFRHFLCLNIVYGLEILKKCKITHSYLYLQSSSSKGYMWIEGGTGFGGTCYKSSANRPLTWVTPLPIMIRLCLVLVFETSLHNNSFQCFCCFSNTICSWAQMVLSAWLKIEGQLPSTMALIKETGSGHLENYLGREEN